MQDLTCNDCKITFENGFKKKRHDRYNHPKVKEKKCRVCPELSFKTEGEYLMHVRDIHKGKSVNCYMCNVCGKTFKTRSELTQHINSKCSTEKQFSCKECGQKLMTPGSLYNHMRRHKGSANFMCRFCAKLFLTAGQLKVHERIHTQAKDFVCDVCDKGFCHRQSLITHSSIHTGIKPYQCEGCGKSFSCVGNLLKHRKTHPDSCGMLPSTTHRVQNPSTRIKVKINTPATSKLREIQKNKEFQEKFAKLADLIVSDINKNGHNDTSNQKSKETSAVEGELEEIEDKNGDCGSTVEDVDDLSNLNDFTGDEYISETSDSNNISYEENIGNKINPHDNIDQNNVIKNGLPNLQQKFPECDQKEKCKEINKSKKVPYKRKVDRDFDKELKLFIKHRKLENEKTAPCKYCHKEYSHFRWLYRHEKEHEKNDISVKGEVKTLPYKCSCCKKCFETKDEMKEHQQHTHADVLTCFDCGDKMFANLDSLRSHQDISHKGVPRKEYIYICEKCGRKFKQKQMLEFHNKTNCKGPFFRCEICMKEFSSEHTRKAHMRIHTSEKNLVCRFCGKSFHWKGQLKVHERSHTGEKPYTCLFCPSAFAYRDSLITHSTMHTGFKPYFCKGCGWRFSCMGNLAKHRTTHASTCGAWYLKNTREENV